MPYSKQTWTDNVTVVDKSHMDHLEDGLVLADGNASTALIGKPSYGTTLPASPVDGQEAILVDSTTNPSYQWRFRWNAGSSSAYKWEFVGGRPAYAAIAGGAGPTSVLYPTWTTLSGPSFVAPCSGDYVCAYAANGSNTVDAAAAMINVQHAAVGPADQSLVYGMVSGGGGYIPLCKRDCLLGVGVGETIQIVYAAHLGGAASFDRRTLLVEPMRVS